MGSRCDYVPVQDVPAAEEGEKPNELPVNDKLKIPSRPCPEHSSSLISQLFWHWVNPLMSRGFKHEITVEDLWQLPDFMKNENCSEIFDRLWKEKQHKPKRALLWTIFDAIRPRFYWVMLRLRLAMLTLTFVYPFLLKAILEYVKQPDGSKLTGFLLSGAIALVAVFQGISTQRYYWYGVRCALFVRGGLISLIYRKALRTCLAERRDYPAGTIVNLASVDSDAIMNFTWSSIHDIWGCPLHIIISLSLLLKVLGPASLLGVALMVGSLSLTVFISRKMAKIQEQSLAACDQRIRMMNEVLSGMKLIKLYAWEEAFKAKVGEIRAKQHRLVRIHSTVGAINRFLGSMAPLFVSLASFAAYTLIFGHVLDASTAFTALLLFNTLKEPLGKLPEVLDLFVRTLLSAQRIERFLRAEEVQHYLTYLDPENAGPIGARIFNGTFAYQDPQKKKHGHHHHHSEHDKKHKRGSGRRHSSSSSSSASAVEMQPLPNGATVSELVVETVPEEEWYDEGEDTEGTEEEEEEEEEERHLAKLRLFPIEDDQRASDMYTGEGEEEDEEKVAGELRKGRKKGGRLAVPTKDLDLTASLASGTHSVDDFGAVEVRVVASSSSPSRSPVRKPVRFTGHKASRRSTVLASSRGLARVPSFAAGLTTVPTVVAPEVRPEEGKRKPKTRIEIEEEMLQQADPTVPCLRNINVTFPAGGLTIIVGPVGSGKSSIINALLGELYCISGEVSVPRKVAYTPQQPWLLNDTIRGNILFGHPYDPVRYETTIRVCALQRDLSLFPHGDATEIGENGINLSGGQKQRIGLARAVYANADLIMMDEPLSAVDAHVGKWLFDHVLGRNGVLAGKTRILVTHQLQFVPGADWVIVMKDGVIEHQGTYQELVAKGLRFESIVDMARSPPGSDKLQPPDANSADAISELELPPAFVDNSSTGGHPAVLSAPISPSAGSVTSESAASHEGALTPSGSSVTSFPASPLASPVFGEGSRDSAVVIEVKSPKEEGVKGDDSVPTSPSQRQQPSPQQWDGSITKEETVLAANVTTNVYSKYLKHAGGLPMLLAAVFCLFASQISSIGADMFLAYWSSHPQRVNGNSTDLGPNPAPHADIDEDTPQAYYVEVYATLAGFAAALFLTRVLTIVLFTSRASRNIHNAMFNALMRAPMSFFDSTPSGRIINRCGKDQEITDSTLPGVIQDIFSCTIAVLGTVGLICYVAPIASIPVAIIAAGYLWVQIYYMRTSRQLKRREAVSRSPIYSHFTESLHGVTSIRAFKSIERFEALCRAKVDQNVLYYFTSFAVNRWLAIRLDVVGALVIFTAASIAFLLQGSLSAGYVGLVITYTLALSGNLNWMVRQMSELEVQMNAVERILEFSEIPAEAPPVIPDSRPPATWPLEGRVQFENVVVKYREDTPPILKQLNADIKPGEKIGIVGRTGAGKSTLTLVLFRIVEPSGGRILIDGVDITKIGLQDLRSRISIIPQDPVLFAGTIRSNLDPFNQCTDEELWGHLERIHMRETVEALPGGLNAAVDENGENFSVGERQLICLGRAMARKSRIVIMDEASASLDFKTDLLIREFVQNEFKDCTVLTIAHRLNTVMDSDRIMVLDAGRVVEFDSPARLCANPNSIFASLVRDATTKDQH